MKLLTPVEIRNAQFLKQSFHASGIPGAPNLRMIDKVSDEPRHIPLKLLCLGASRSGTLSLMTALLQLGYRPYHMAEAVKNAPVDFAIWEEAVAAKFDGVGDIFTKAQWDRFLGGYDVIMEFPAMLFAEELMELYPDAKVILTHRPVQGWVKSMRNTVWGVYAWRMWPWVAWADSDMAGPWYRFAVRTYTLGFGNIPDTRADNAPDPLSTHPESSAAKYLRHSSLIREKCAPERLLEMELGDGFEKLCSFLSIPVPKQPYPRFNDRHMFVNMHDLMLRRAIRLAALKIVCLAVLIVLLVWVLCSTIAFG